MNEKKRIWPSPRDRQKQSLRQRVEDFQLQGLPTQTILLSTSAMKQLLESRGWETKGISEMALEELGVLTIDGSSVDNAAAQVGLRPK